MNHTKPTRREWLKLSMIFSALLMPWRVSATAKPACPISFDEFTPDEITLQDAICITEEMFGDEPSFKSLHNFNQESVVALLWRFHSLPPDQAAQWLKAISDNLDRRTEEWHSRAAVREAEYERYLEQERRAKEVRDGD